MQESYASEKLFFSVMPRDYALKQCIRDFQDDERPFVRRCIKVVKFADENFTYKKFGDCLDWWRVFRYIIEGQGCIFIKNGKMFLSEIEIRRFENE